MSTLEQIKARAAAATEGPWQHEPWGGQNQNGDYSGGNVFDAHGEYLISEVSDADGEFIAHARQDVPRLVAALEAALSLVDHFNAITVQYQEGVTEKFGDTLRATINAALEGATK